MVKNYVGKLGSICCRNWNQRALLKTSSHCMVGFSNQEIVCMWAINLTLMKMILSLIDEIKRKNLIHNWALQWRDFTNQPIDEIYSYFGTKVTNDVENCSSISTLLKCLFA